MRRLLLCTLFAFLALPSPNAHATDADAAAYVTVSGTLAAHAGLNVLAVSPNGHTRRVKLNALGRFSFRLTQANARNASLQLINPSGRYFGPVVLAKTTGRAFTSLGGTTVELGTLRMYPGYAIVPRALPAAAVNRTRFARADNAGKPAGAGKLGFVRSGIASARGPAAEAVTGPGDDPDGDGLPNAFDVDDNGNGTFDNVDRSSAANPGSNAGLFSTLYAGFGQALNVNAGSAVGRDDIDALINSQSFGLVYYFDSGQFPGRTITGADVDCFALVYCRRDTGTAVIGGLSESGPSLPRDTPWVDYNPDGSGLPNLESLSGGSVWAMGVQPRVTTANIHPGDTFAVNFRTATEVITVPTSLSNYFVTTPAIKRWANGTTTTDVTYPVTDPSTGTFTAPSGSLTLNLWRPQRPSLPGAGETGGYMDMGRLHYGLTAYVPGHPEIGCGGFFTGLSGTLRDDWVPGSTDPAKRLFPLTDTSVDTAPSPSRQLQVTVDLAGCLEAADLDPAGQTVTWNLTAASEGRPGGMDRAAQSFQVTFP